MIDQDEPGVFISLPLPGDRVFRNQAMEDILQFLYRNPHQEFGVRQLREITGHGAQTATDALDLLSQLDLIETQRKGNKKLISINHERIFKPKDPLMRVPQEEFREPIKAFLEKLKEEQDNLVGTILFGSVARGEADRESDIDVLAIVKNNLTSSRRSIHDLRQQLSQKKFEGNRYEFQVMVESLESAEQYGKKLKTIFSEGIVLYNSKKLEELREGVLDG